MKVGSQSVGNFWIMLEVDLAMVASCMPTFGPLVFETHSALESLRKTMSGFLPLSGDSGSLQLHPRLKSKPSREGAWAA